jgi:hypothetical protein
MTADDRAQAIARFGFTPRQARFLVTVMRQAGVCLPRQYARFAGIVQGQKTRAFFAKLVDRGYASAYACRHNRGRVYYLHQHALYAAIGEPNSRYRRPVTASAVIERLIVLDMVIAGRDLTWLETRAEKLTHFTSEPLSVAVDKLPYAVATAAASPTHAFPDRLPIGVDRDGRTVLLYLAGSGDPDRLPAFLQRHRDLLHHLPAWTIRLVFPRVLENLYDLCQRIVHDELESPLSARSLEELVWYFEQCREASRNRHLPMDDRFRRAKHAFDEGRFQRLYYVWQRGGRSALEHASSAVLSDALDTGVGRIESLVLPHRYDHLAPVVDRVESNAARVEKGAEKSHKGETNTLHGLSPGRLTTCESQLPHSNTSLQAWSPRERIRRQRLARSRRRRSGGALCRPARAVRMLRTAEPWRERPPGPVRETVPHPVQGSLTPRLPGPTIVCAHSGAMRRRSDSSACTRAVERHGHMHAHRAVVGRQRVRHVRAVEAAIPREIVELCSLPCNALRCASPAPVARLRH